MKKVLFVTSISGFLPQFEQNDVKLLKKMGCEIHYASNFNNPVYTFNPQILKEMGVIPHQIDIEKSPGKIWKNWKSCRQLIKIIDQYGIDIIHCHNPMGGFAGRFASFICKRKTYVIYTAHGFHFYKGAPVKNWLLFYPAERLMAHLTDCIVTINKEDYNRAGNLKLKTGGMVCQIHSVGVDQRRFSPNEAIAAKKREELSVPSDAFHIVTAAELTRNKNQQIIIRAIARMAEKDVYYSICGRGPCEEELRSLIEKQGLKDRVRLLGFRTDMEEILQTADCFAFPSHREGLGVAAVEALLCGVPLVAANNRGTREYAVDNENALCMEADDEDGFLNALTRLYHDKNLRNKLKSNARSSAKMFVTEEVEKIMRLVYEKAMERENWISKAVIYK